MKYNMIDIGLLYSGYSARKVGSLSDDDKKELREHLSNMHMGSLKTVEDHKHYIELVKMYRESLLNSMELIGGNFVEMIKAMLTVGEDGLYSNNLRFLYELIQNVDDCDYSCIDDCDLDIKFRWNLSPGEIILTYNEEGFKPKNVFDISGIAEKSKNIDATKIEIGEKGIGFKSVFGVAEKVLIQSGDFSFVLHEDNFTVPIPYYEKFEHIKGTRMTLFLSSTRTEEIYRELVKQYYNSKGAVINKNPILFLNKLTHLKIHFDGFRYLDFRVSRSQIENNNIFSCEPNVIVSMDMKDHSKNGVDREYKKDIRCIRYTMPVLYDRIACVSRYSEKTAFIEKSHRLAAVVPEVNDIDGIEKGNMYSFLPTQIKIKVPIAIHVPFKLDGSREFVDPQKNNEWFQFTIKKLSEFLSKMYIDLAQKVKQDIIRYIPKYSEYFFEKDNEKVSCLCIDTLKGSILKDEKIYFTQNETFEIVDDVIAFPKEDFNQHQSEIYKYLDCKKALFVPNTEINMRAYGMELIDHIDDMLFKNMLNDSESTEGIYKILCDRKFIFSEGLKNYSEQIHLDQKQMSIISKNRELYRSFCDLEENIVRRGHGNLYIAETLNLLEGNDKETIVDLIENSDIDRIFESYMKRIHNNIYVVDNVAKGFYYLGTNGIVLSKNEPLLSFGNLYEPYDDRKTFSATLKLRQASESLNKIDNTTSNTEYLKALRDVRNGLISAFGKDTYERYIQIINKSGADKSRFLNELLQNADDCNYDRVILNGQEPQFTLKLIGNNLVVSYNEDGFEKDNVRAITAIGESTKKLLLNGQDKAIGEKGVGFKSVFSVARSVEIHSNGFDFMLTDEKPTFPAKCDAEELVTGTMMKFDMKSNMSSVFDTSYVLRLCLCLRKLRNIRVQDTNIHIEDNADERIITLNGNNYYFEKFTFPFIITDKEALDERNTNNRVFNENQTVFCYIPKEYKEQDIFLYAGLPTTIKSNIPLIIDAPFELTTSRDTVLQNKWNEIVNRNVHLAILKLMEEKKTDIYLDVLKYTGFKNQNNVSSFKTFEDDYLNRFAWIDYLKKMEILPVLGAKDTFLSTDKGDCAIVPDIIAQISAYNNMGCYFNGIIIDTLTKSHYISLLEVIGCRKVEVDSILNCIKNFTSIILEREKLRNALYSYLVNNAQSFKSTELRRKICELCIFPVRTQEGTNYIPFSSEIYLHDTEVSKDGYYILNTDIMTYDTCYKILGETHSINKLTQEVFDAKYQRNIEAYIESKHSSEEIARYLLREFTDNAIAFRKCKNILKGLLQQIPFKMEDGLYKSGNKFTNISEQFFGGKLIQSLTIDKRFLKLALFLDCKDIRSIHYSDIDVEIEKISDDDIADLQCDFDNYSEIIKEMYKSGFVSDNQVREFCLDFVKLGDPQYVIQEEFPGRAVKDIKRLHEHIIKEWVERPNPIIEKQVIQKKPKYPLNNANYALSMYESSQNKDMCFCQMCKKITNIRYVERNNVEKEPEFAWDQMYLNLCLKCSKDYIYLRSNEVIWHQFISNIIEVDVLEDENFEISISDTTISFTATHLAEIQEIYRNVHQEIFYDVQQEKKA